ncbi:MAG: phosphogluconate dehydrogenase (NAD(+)-dependent, decarboxylating) [Candidatus Bathyarchaeia archaeon]
MSLGIIGLGKIGSNLALQCIDKGVPVVGFDLAEKTELTHKGVKVAKTLQDFINSLSRPRVICLYLPAGKIIDQVITEILPFIEKSDVIVDGGNSYFKDSIRRETELSEKGIFFVDCGTSGGVNGARNGACFMVGGKPEAVAICEPVLKKLAVENGFLHVGEPGSGHYVKLVHNGIEFGMLQAIGEGVELLKHGDFSLDLAGVFKVWSNGSVIRSWLVELMAQGLSQQEGLDKVPDFVEDTGEVNWLVGEAIEKEIPVPVITQSVMELFKSRQPSCDAAKAVAVMRHGFGGHPFGKDDYIAKERRESKIKK